MKIFLLTQKEVDDYDTYDSMVVVAETKSKAQKIHPIGLPIEKWRIDFPCWATDWRAVKVRYLGEANKSIKAGVILTSFNAG